MVEEKEEKKVEMIYHVLFMLVVSCSCWPNYANYFTQTETIFTVHLIHKVSKRRKKSWMKVF